MPARHYDVKPGQVVTLAPGVTVTLVGLRGAGKALVGVDAPRSVAVLRGELLARAAPRPSPGDSCPRCRELGRSCPLCGGTRVVLR